MKEEGVIKFNCNWIKTEPLNIKWLKDLNDWRNKLYKSGLLGINKEGIGYGNISIRFQNGSFIITGSGTGKFKRLTAAHYTQVTAYHIDENSLTAIGPIVASSESLTHAMIYECQSGVHAVLHVHHLKLWEHLLNTLPSTNKNIAYGTVGMAHEISRLFKDSDLSNHKIFAMAGHEEGVVSFGKNLDEAARVIFEQLNQIKM